jgi:ribonucleoside-triphosphate reductase
MTINSKVRQPCEVYSRVCGYMRPVSNFNDAKQAEWKERKMFKYEGQTE